ncbi:MAG: hypothetical protein SGJ11_16525, partial [Phycisphaerae bacterium]|nr:hypothetical protein [Phycisphaerae bacterium]
MERTARKIGSTRSEQSAFIPQLHNQTFEREGPLRKQLEDPPHVVCGARIGLDHASPVFADIEVSVRRKTDEPSFLDSSCKPFTHIDRLLLGEERRHIRKRSSHHPASRGASGFRVGSRPARMQIKPRRRLAPAEETRARSG